MKSMKLFLGYCYAREKMFLPNEVITMYYNYDGNNRVGHIVQSYFAAQIFVESYPIVKYEILKYPEDEPFQLQKSELLLPTWYKCLDENRYISGSDSDGNKYDFRSLIMNLPESLGGEKSNGGAWGYPLKVVLPLVVRFI